MDTDALVPLEELVLGAKKVFLYLLWTFTQKSLVYNVASIVLMCKVTHDVASSFDDVASSFLF